MKNDFYIIDGHSQIHRAFHAPFRPLTSPYGEPTKATYLFTRMLMKLCREKQPAYLAMAVDGPRKKLLRSQVYPEYKGNRKAQPDSGLLVQVERIKQVVTALGVPILYDERHEADDIIATLVDTVKGTGLRVTIVSRDKDLMTLVKDGEVELYDPSEEKYWDEAAVKARWGVPPARLLDLFTLIGDGGDNVPGCPGVGEKTALKLLKEHGNLKGVVGNAAFIKGKLGEKVGKYDWRWTRRLIKLCRDVDLDSVDPDSLRFKGLDYNKARPLFRKLGFKRWE